MAYKEGFSEVTYKGKPFDTSVKTAQSVRDVYNAAHMKKKTHGKPKSVGSTSDGHMVPNKYSKGSDKQLRSKGPGHKKGY